MLRRAIPADLPSIRAIRDAPGESPLSDPARPSDGEAARLVAERALWLWDEAGAVLGFAAADRRDGAIPGLLVARGHDGKGIGRALLAAACDFLRAAGHATARLELAPGSAAERHYRNSGWALVGRNDKRGAIFQKPL